MRIMLFAVAAMVASGCAPKDAPLENTSGVRAGDEIPAPFTPESDGEYLDALAAHHAQGIEVASHEASRGADPEVRAMAEKIVKTQTAEIREIEEIRARISSAPIHRSEPDPRMQEDIAKLKQLSGRELDRDFLTQMIAHHAGAIQMTHRAMPNLESREVMDIAHRTHEEQAREIGEMQKKLADLGGMASR
jgi:uncharacterized protein (DUF305 family)